MQFRPFFSSLTFFLFCSLPTILHFVDMYEVCRENVINIDGELIASDPWATFIAKGDNVYNEIQMDNVLYNIIFHVDIWVQPILLI